MPQFGSVNGDGQPEREESSWRKELSEAASKCLKLTEMWDEPSTSQAQAVSLYKIVILF